MNQPDIFTKTVQKANEWLDDICVQMGWRDNRPKALAVLRATLHQLRDNLTINDSSHLSAQLPLLIRGLYFENWRPAEVPVKDRMRDVFVASVEQQLCAPIDFDVEDAIQAVFVTMGRHVSEGEIQKLVGLLPKQLKELWT